MMGQKQSYLTSNIIHSVFQQKFIEHIVHICHSSRFQFRSVQSLVRIRLFATPMDCSTPGHPLPHQLWECTQTHVHLSRWGHPTISSSVIPFSSCLQYFPTSESFQKSQLFASGGQRVSASTSVLPMNTQDWSPLGWTGWVCLQSKGLSRLFSNTAIQ